MRIYTVTSGDTLYRIARKTQTPMEDIIYVNQLQAPGKLSVGQALLLPDPRFYTVREGDTLYHIAKRHNLSLRSLLDANPGLRDPDRLHIGQVIVLPVDNVGTYAVTVNGYFSDPPDAALDGALPYLSLLSAFSARADAAGGLTKHYDVALKPSAEFGVKNLLTVTNLREKGGFSGEIAHALLTGQTAQDTLVNNIFQALEQDDFDGVNLDFEYVFPYDRASYNQFLARLSDALHRRGYLFVTALAPKTSDEQKGVLYEAHDYAFHGQVADFCVLMTYEWGYTYSPPGPVAPVNEVERVLRYAVTEIPPQKLLMGIPNYGYDWTLPFEKGAKARALTNVAAVTLAAQNGAEIRFDKTAQTPFFRYAKDGSTHEVWFEDARSLQAKLHLVEQYRLGGVSYWRLDSLYRTLFATLEQMYQIRKLE